MCQKKKLNIKHFNNHSKLSLNVYIYKLQPVFYFFYRLYVLTHYELFWSAGYFQNHVHFCVRNSAEPDLVTVYNRIGKYNGKKPMSRLGMNLYKNNMIYGHNSPVTEYAFSTKANELASGSADEIAYVEFESGGFCFGSRRQKTRSWR